MYDVQYYEQYNKAVPDDGDGPDPVIDPDSADPDLKRVKRSGPMTYWDHQGMDELDVGDLARRAAAPGARSGYWQRSANSLPKGAVWRADGADDPNEDSFSYDRAAAAGQQYQFWYDSAAGFDSGTNQGYNVYIINEAWVYAQHPVSSDLVCRQRTTTIHPQTQHTNDLLLL